MHLALATHTHPRKFIHSNKNYNNSDNNRSSSLMHNFLFLTWSTRELDIHEPNMNLGAGIERSRYNNTTQTRH